MENKNEYRAYDYWLEYDFNEHGANDNHIKDIDDLIFAGECVKLYSER